MTRRDTPRRGEGTPPDLHAADLTYAAALNRTYPGLVALASAATATEGSARRGGLQPLGLQPLSLRRDSCQAAIVAGALGGPESDPLTLAALFDVFGAPDALGTHPTNRQVETQARMMYAAYGRFVVAATHPGDSAPGQAAAQRPPSAPQDAFESTTSSWLASGASLTAVMLGELALESGYGGRAPGDGVDGRSSASSSASSERGCRGGAVAASRQACHPCDAPSGRDAWFEPLASVAEARQSAPARCCTGQPPQPTVPATRCTGSAAAAAWSPPTSIPGGVPRHFGASMRLSTGSSSGADTAPAPLSATSAILNELAGVCVAAGDNDVDGSSAATTAASPRDISERVMASEAAAAAARQLHLHAWLDQGNFRSSPSSGALSSGSNSVGSVASDSTLGDAADVSAQWDWPPDGAPGPPTVFSSVGLVALCAAAWLRDGPAPGRPPQAWASD